MKGLELPINMIIIIAIAVLVLVVIAAFFTGYFGSGTGTISLEQAHLRHQSQHEFEMQQTRHQWCGTYSQYNPTCEKSIHDTHFSGATSDTKKDEILSKIGSACKGLNIPYCTSNTASFQCIQSCCLHCPETSS